MRPSGVHLKGGLRGAGMHVAVVQPAARARDVSPAAVRGPHRYAPSPRRAEPHLTISDQADR
jgi:hypothetical protein